MDAELWITFNEQMDLIWHDLSAKNFCLMLLTDFKNDLLQALCYGLDEHLAPLFGTPDDMILARVGDVPVRCVRYCTHDNEYTASSHRGSSIGVTPPPKPPSKERAFYPCR